MGALSITGIPALKTPFEPLVPGAVKVPNTNFYRAPELRRRRRGLRPVGGRRDRAGHRAGGARDRGRRLPRAGAERRRAASRRRRATSPGSARSATATACCSSPTRSSAPSAGSGEWFGADRYGYQPDIITVAKGLTSGYAPLGAMIASDRLVEPFLHGDAQLPHGFTFAGHPVSCAVALANLDVFERDEILDHVQSTEAAFRAALETPLRPPDRGRRPGRRVLLRHRAREGQGDPGVLRRRREREAAARLPLRAPCSRPGSSAGPTTGVTRWCSCRRRSSAGRTEIDFMVATLRDVLTEAWRRI